MVNICRQVAGASGKHGFSSSESSARAYWLRAIGSQVNRMLREWLMVADPAALPAVSEVIGYGCTSCTLLRITMVE